MLATKSPNAHWSHDIVLAVVLTCDLLVATTGNAQVFPFTYESTAPRYRDVLITGTSLAPGGAYIHRWESGVGVAGQIEVDGPAGTVRYNNTTFRDLTGTTVSFTESRSAPGTFPNPPETRTAQVVLNLRFADIGVVTDPRPVTWNAGTGTYAFDSITVAPLRIEGDWSIRVTGVGIDQTATGLIDTLLSRSPGFEYLPSANLNLWNQVSTVSMPDSLALEHGDTPTSERSNIFYWYSDYRPAPDTDLPVPLLNTTVGGVAFDYGISGADRLTYLTSAVAVPEPSAIVGSVAASLAAFAVLRRRPRVRR